MSRIDELKKQHPIYALSAIDIYKMMSPNQTNKYVEMLIKLDKDKEFNAPDAYRRQIIECMVEWGIDYNYLETFDLETLNMFFLSINNLMGDTGKIRTFTKFASLNERKLIDNNDVTSYSTWDEINQAVALADVKLLDKKLEKEIKKVYEDDTWISLRPLSLEASMKYGANTKWCTTTESGQYYARYSARGILIYNINKKTGYKVACFKNLSPEHDNEFSWWDVTDRRIEALDSEAPSVVLEAVRNEIKNHPYYNSHLMSDEEQAKLDYYKEGIKLNSGVNIGTGHLSISGGFYPSTGTSTTLTTGGNTGGNTFDYNPSTFTTTTDNVLRFSTTSNVGMGTTTPSAQLSVHGDMEINGDVILRSDGEERMRLTSEGNLITFGADGQRYLNGIMQQPEQPLQEYNHFEQPTEEQRRFMAELRFRDNDRIAEDAQQRLDDAMAEQMAEANERVAQKHLSLLDNIELGTLDNDTKIKMQMLAGIKTTKQQIQQLEAEIEQLRSQEAQPEVVHSSIWNKIKNTGRKLGRRFTNRSRRQIGASPMSVSARLEAVKQSQEQ